MKRITFDDSAGMTLMELGMALMVERDDTTSLLTMAKEFETHWRTPGQHRKLSCPATGA